MCNSRVSALAFDCKQCMYMLSDNEDVNRILDSTMSGALSDSPISYTADCKDGASSIVSTTCPAKMGCAAMKINALMKAGSKFSENPKTFRKHKT